MNSGAFGENFPYSNYHDLNMDWIIKIAKDFLDQYTHIQELIEQGKTDIQNLTEQGLDQLQEKADTLEGLLQAWYNEHSEDIANQLADALQDLNDWYTQHQGYLDQILQDNITAFNNATDLKAQQTLESIPADYTALAHEVDDMKAGMNTRNVFFKRAGILPDLPVDFFWNDDPTWQQGTWTSSGDSESPYWIRTGLINGGFIIHNKNSLYGYVVGKFTDAGQFVSYPWMSSLVNDEWYYIPPVEAGYKVKFRQRHMTSNTTPMTPAEATVEIFRFTNAIYNSPHYVGNNTIEAYGTTINLVSGNGNFISNARASHWTDIPFGGVFINTEYTPTYDFQMILPIDRNDFAYRIVNRTDHTVFLNWQLSSDNIANYLHYALSDATTYENTFALVAGTGQKYGNLAYSQWNDIPFGGCAINMEYTATYDIQIIFSLEKNRIAYRHVNRVTKIPFDNWHFINGNGLYGKTVSIIGDSRSAYSGTVPTGNATYYPRLGVTNENLMWWKRVVNFFNMTRIVNDSYSGGYVANRDGNNGANIASSDTAIDNLGTTAPDIILIYEGVNDWNANNDPNQLGTYNGTGTFPTSNAKFREAFAIMIRKIQNKFPNADIWILTNPYCCPVGTGSTASQMPVPKNPINITLDAYNQAMIEIGRMMGCNIIDLSGCGTNWNNITSYTGDFTTDNGLHYNADGQELIANVVIGALASYYQN